MKDYKGVFIEFRQQWTSLFGKYNWYTFQFAFIEFEWDKMMGGVEFTCIILGLGFRVRYNYAVTDTVEEVMSGMEEFGADEVHLPKHDT